MLKYGDYLKTHNRNKKVIEVITRPSIRKADKPEVIMSRLDYVIIQQVIDRLHEIGMGDDELSFLLGKPNNYMFGFIMKPSEKNRFNEDQIDLLPHLLQCPFSRIIPNGTAPGNIHLHHTKRIDEDGYKGFSHIVYSATGTGTRVIWKKKNAPVGSTRKTNKKLLDLLITWIDEGYFDQKRTALELYNRLNAENEINFRPSELEKCIKILASKSQQRLEKRSIDGVLTYWKKGIA